MLELASCAEREGGRHWRKGTHQSPLGSAARVNKSAGQRAAPLAYFWSSAWRGWLRLRKLWGFRGPLDRYVSHHQPPTSRTGKKFETGKRPGAPSQTPPWYPPPCTSRSNTMVGRVRDSQGIERLWANRDNQSPLGRQTPHPAGARAPAGQVRRHWPPRHHQLGMAHQHPPRHAVVHRGSPVAPQLRRDRRERGHPSRPREADQGELTNLRGAGAR